MEINKFNEGCKRFIVNVVYFFGRVIGFNGKVYFKSNYVPAFNDPIALRVAGFKNCWLKKHRNLFHMALAEL